ncbi:MAG: hypothetical protein M0Z28_06525 [Rhodospirillales bacterium]|nr:hypothetical protein [Rhodospirillales bacterium]
MRRAQPLARRDDTDALMARVASSAASGVARRALLLRLSRLPAAYARPHHLRLARAALDPLRTADRAETFDLPNTDTAVLWRGPGGGALQASLDAVTELFAGSADAAPGPESLCLVLDLPEQAETLLRLARESHAGQSAAPARQALVPLDAAELAGLEAALARADLARFARRRPVWAVGTDGRVRLAWEKRVISVAELQAELAPGRALRAEPWLFQRLSRTLDRRMLALLAAPGELRAAGPFAIELSVASLLGAEFLRFDAVLPAALRGRVVIHLRAPDILGDLPAFLFAREFARARGYRLLLHGIGAELAPALPPARLGIDLTLIGWSSALAGTDPRALGVDPAMVVLGGAELPDALAWARRHGITLFQSRTFAPGNTRS